MTSFLIKAHVDRPSAPSSAWQPAAPNDPDCTFCRIIAHELPAARVYETASVVAFLDILPLRRGHTLVVPKAHYARLSELPGEVAADVGKAVTKVAHALTQALDNTALNVVCNQEYAQAVPHVHYHVIPAPTFDSQPQPSPSPSPAVTAPLTQREMHQLEFEGRLELDDDDAVVLAGLIGAKL